MECTMLSTSKRKLHLSVLVADCYLVKRGKHTPKLKRSRGRIDILEYFPSRVPWVRPKVNVQIWYYRGSALNALRCEGSGNNCCNPAPTTLSDAWTNGPSWRAFGQSGHQRRRRSAHSLTGSRRLEIPRMMIFGETPRTEVNSRIDFHDRC